MSFLQSLIRPHLIELTPYASARDEYKGSEGIFLDANENPFGSVSGDAYNRYPDPHQVAIKEKLARLKKVNASQIFLGNGSDEAIDLLIKTFCEPKIDNIVILPPTYGMYKVCADIQQVEVLSAALTADFDLDTEKIQETVNEHTKMIWVCSPNNPSGNLVNQDKIRLLLEKYPNKMVVVDEAYIDFVPEKTWLNELEKYPNLIVLQTFSKAWGMAGLRIGVAYAHAEIIQILNKIKYPYSLNILTQKAVLDALNFEDRKNEMVKQLNELREKLREQLNKLPFVTHIYPSDSNQLLVRVNQPSELFGYLIEQKIIVRDRSKVILCEGCLRISVGSEEENEALVQEMKRWANQ